MKAARFFRFGTAVAVAALLAGSAFRANALNVNLNVGSGVVTVSLGPGHYGNYDRVLYREAERLANAMRFELRLNERTYRKVLEFYLREMRIDHRGNVVMVPRDREDREMHRILNGTEYRIWKAHNGAHMHVGGPAKGPGPARGPAPKPGRPTPPPPAHRF